MNQKLLLKYIRNYLGVLGIFCLLMVPIYFTMYRESRESVLNVTEEQLNREAADLDNRINKMRIITDILRNNEHVRKVADIHITPAPEDSLDLLKSKDYLVSCLTMGMEDGSGYMLFKNNNVVVTTGALLSSSMYHDYRDYGRLEMDYEEFKKYIFDNRIMIQFLPLICDGQNTGITCILKGPNNLGGGNNYDMALVFELNQETLNRLFNIDVSAQADFAYIQDFEGKVIYQVNFLGEPLTVDELAKGKVKYHGENYSILQTQTRSNGLSLVVGISDKTLGKGIIGVNRIIWMYLIAAVVCMILFCVAWAVRKTISMRKILLALKSENDKELFRNEYQYITGKIVSLHKENEDYRLKIDDLQKSIFSSMVERLLIRGVYTQKEKEELQNYLSWDMEFYCVVCLYTGLQDDTEILDCFCRADAFLDFHFACISAGSGKNERAYIVKMEKYDRPDVTRIREILKIFATEQSDIWVGISSVGTGLENVALCYGQAKLMARQIADSYDVKVHEFQGYSDYRGKIFKLNLDDRLHDLILAEEKEALKTLFEKIRSYVSKSIFDTEAELQQLFFEICNPIAKIWDEIEWGRTPEREFPVYRSDKTIKELLKDLENLAYYLCDCIHRGKESSKNAFCEKMIRFVDENYTNKDMCISFAASNLGISGKQLVVLFKEQTGKNFSAYVEARRMQQVEKYLLETDWTMAQIADAVGYNTIDTFYKSFKKIYGLAPGKWKDSRK